MLGADHRGDWGGGSIPVVNLQTFPVPKIPGLGGSRGGSEGQPNESTAQSPSLDREIVDFTSPIKDSLVLQLTTEAEVEENKEDPAEDVELSSFSCPSRPSFVFLFCSPFGVCKLLPFRDFIYVCTFPFNVSLFVLYIS